MPGHHSLLSSQAQRNSSFQPGRPAGLGVDPRQQAMMAAPTFFDRMLGRGSYIKEFSARRGNIIKQAQLEKRRRRLDFRRHKAKTMERLKEGDKKTYQEFNIRQSQRASKPGLEEREQERLFKKNVKDIEKDLRVAKRQALREIEHQRDRDIRRMKDELREQLYSTAA